MQSETIEDFTNLLKDTLMYERVSTHSTPLPLLVDDFKQRISTDPSKGPSEKTKQLANLNIAYRSVVEELIGSN